MILKDKQNRDNAVEVCDRNIIVEAGAGTGKTTLLVKKILYLIFVKKVKLSRLIALTFTKKAAASLKQKLQEDLYNAYKILLHNNFVLNTNDTDFEIRLQEYTREESDNFKKFRPLFKKSGLQLNELFDIIKTALEEIPFCKIGTIHSFCFFILKKYALEAGLNPNINIDENGYIDIIFDKNWAIFLDEELSLNSYNKNIWLSILKHISLNDLKDFARSLCSVRFNDYTPKENYNFLMQQAQKYIQEAEILLKTAPDISRSKLKPVLKDATDSLKQTIDVYNGKNNNLKAIEFPERNPSQPSKWGDGDYKTAIQIINFAKANIPQNQIILLQAYNLLKPFTLKVQKEIMKENYLTFDDIIFQAHHLLLNNKAVREEIKRSYDRIFIDEFQDTDPVQGEIMLFLAEDINTFANRWQDLKLTPGKLFIVGDPKQSIYHFRGADISAYQAFCNLLTKQGALTCNLQNNFRSAQKIIDYVNIFGKSQIKFQANRQTEYKEIYATKEFKNPRLESYLYEGEFTPEIFRKNYAQTIAKWICENVKKTNKSDGTPLEYKDIAILIPTAPEINIFLNALKENNIPYNVEEDKNFYSAQEVLDFINILKVLKNPNDQVALLGVLRSPIGLITDTQLVNLCKENKLNIYAEINNKKVKNIYEKLKYLRAKISNLNPIEITNEILETFYFATYQSLASLQEQTLANIHKIKQVVENIFNNGAYTLEQILDNFETYQKQQNKESSAILAEENFNVVKILTIHKAKGLEYPVVILTDLSKDFTKSGNNKISRDKKEFYSRALGKRGLALGQLHDGTVSLIKEEKKAQEFEEKKRLLYVAMTRAKETLVIVDRMETENNTLSNFLALAGCWPTQREDNLHSSKIIYLQAQDIDISVKKQDITEDKDFVFDYTTWEANYTKNEEEYKQYLKNLKVKTNENKTIFQTPEVEHAIKVGNLCHKLLQNIFTGTDYNLEAENNKEALKEAKDIVNNFCKSDTFKELKEMEFLAAEFPITTVENGLAKNGIIDAIFKTKGGNIKIIDFKSDKINRVSAKTVEPNYLAQIAFYKNALNKIFEGKVECALVYIRPAEIYNVED